MVDWRDEWHKKQKDQQERYGGTRYDIFKSYDEMVEDFFQCFDYVRGLHEISSMGDMMMVMAKEIQELRKEIDSLKHERNTMYSEEYVKQQRNARKIGGPSL